MFLILVGFIIYIFAFIIYYLVKIMPQYQAIGLDWIALFLMMVPWIIVLWRLVVTKSWYQADKLSPWKTLINYLRRDAEIIPVIGERAYSGESFLDVQYLGIFEFLGKDCVYTQGDKKVIWGLENINFSPDPRYWNLTHLLYELGFRNSEDVKNVLNEEKPDLELMGKVYLNMLDDGLHGADLLVDEMQNYDGKIVDFEPTTKDKVHMKLDEVLKRRKET